jgi:phosphotransferase system HPr (HPr) family protein
LRDVARGDAAPPREALDLVFENEEDSVPEITLTVTHEVGLHARPAALFVKKAGQFDADVRVSHDEKEVNAKSILQVLTLGVEKDGVITVRAEGDDAEEALEGLKMLVESDFEVEE